jgi:hypothetical protein
MVEYQYIKNQKKKKKGKKKSGPVRGWPSQVEAVQ